MQPEGLALTQHPRAQVRLEQIEPGHTQACLTPLLQPQFYLVLEGEAHMILENNTEMVLQKRQGILVHPGTEHCIINKGSQPLRYVVTTPPPATNLRHTA